MSFTFFILSALTLAGAIGAVFFRNPIHCALSLAMAFVGLAAHYLRLNAQFVGLAQLLVYIGAVAILIVFAVLLTRSGSSETRARWSTTWWFGAVLALGMSALLLSAMSGTLLAPNEAGTTAPAPEAATRRIGELLMTRYVLPLEVTAVLLTAAMIAAVVLAMTNQAGREGAKHD